MRRLCVCAEHTDYREVGGSFREENLFLIKERFVSHSHSRIKAFHRKQACSVRIDGEPSCEKLASRNRGRRGATQSSNIFSINSKSRRREKRLLHIVTNKKREGE